jgi:multidrug efflux pump subunit AcrA (membrane-fusion protein)
MIVLEAMKMQHAVLAPGDGVVTEVRVKKGEQVAAGQVLAVMDAAAPPGVQAPDLRTEDSGAR